MESKTSTKKISLSSHLEFINWVAMTVGGETNHYNIKLRLDKKWVPDVFVANNDKLKEIHEVEVVHIPQRKIVAYSQSHFPKSVLWVCLPDLGSAFDEVRIVMHFDTPKHRIESVPLEPKKQHKGTVVYIQCQECGRDFSRTNDWVDHLKECKKGVGLDEQIMSDTRSACPLDM